MRPLITWKRQVLILGSLVLLIFLLVWNSPSSQIYQIAKDYVVPAKYLPSDTESPTVLPMTSEKVFAERRQRVHDVCATQKSSGKVDSVFPHPSGVLYCLVPKAGCTFWKRFFRASKLKSNVTKADVFNQTRSAVHFTDGAYGQPFNKIKHNSILYPTRFLVAREPYSRLLSAYLDKVYLPDFWLSALQSMVKTKKNKLLRNESIDSLISPEWDFLRHHFNDIDRTFGNNQSSTANEVSCAKYITFAEFLNGTFEYQDQHWKPIHNICDPCTLKVTHVSHMDSFTADARVLLAKMNMDLHILDGFEDDDQVNLELTSIVDYNYEVSYSSGQRKRNFMTRCLSPKELAYRLWKHFQWRGYIDPDVQYKVPDVSDKDAVKQDLMEQIWPARKSGLEHPERMKEAKRRFKEQAFDTVSKRTIEKLNQRFQLDFQLFGFQAVSGNPFSHS